MEEAVAKIALPTLGFQPRGDVVGAPHGAVLPAPVVKLQHDRAGRMIWIKIYPSEELRIIGDLYGLLGFNKRVLR